MVIVNYLNIIKVLYGWLRGKVIQVQSSIFLHLCHFGKDKYIENNILKYLSHSLKN